MEINVIKCIDHFGFAVQNIDKMLKFLKEFFGAEEYKRTEYSELQQISSIVMLKGINFELMQPISPNGPIGRFMEKSNGGFHHLSILCDDLDDFLCELERKGLKIIGKKFDGPDRFAFIHPKSAKGLLVELTDTGCLGQINGSSGK